MPSGKNSTHSRTPTLLSKRPDSAGASSQLSAGGGAGGTRRSSTVKLLVEEDITTGIVNGNGVTDGVANSTSSSTANTPSPAAGAGPRRLSGSRLSVASSSESTASTSKSSSKKSSSKGGGAKSSTSNGATKKRLNSAGSNSSSSGKRGGRRSSKLVSGSMSNPADSPKSGTEQEAPTSTATSPVVHSEGRAKAGRSKPSDFLSAGGENSPPFKGAPCPIHPTENLHIYCITCNQSVCDVCFNLYHHSGGPAADGSLPAEDADDGRDDGSSKAVATFFKKPAVKHEWKFLSEIAQTSRRTLNPILAHTGQIYNNLAKLIEEVPAKEQQLHRYVDQQIQTIEDSLEEKRRELHEDASKRALSMEDMINAEIARCQEELNVINEGQDVLRALSVGEGVVDGELGQLILGHLSYEDFAEKIHKPIHKADKMLSYQGLQLPVQDLQTMCAMVDWTALSESNAPQLFP